MQTAHPYPHPVLLELNGVLSTPFCPWLPPADAGSFVRSVFA